MPRSVHSSQARFFFVMLVVAFGSACVNSSDTPPGLLVAGVKAGTGVNVSLVVAQ
jgi:hypothetical protein